MQRKKHLATLVTALIMVIATLTWASSAAASSYKVLHTFTWYSAPMGNLIFDAAGNLYGTTSGGGPKGCGNVYKLAPNPDGTWTYSVLHSFRGPGGCNPQAGLTFDAAGNLYGTTTGGGGSTTPVSCSGWRPTLTGRGRTACSTDLQSTRDIIPSPP